MGFLQFNLLSKKTKENKNKKRIFRLVITDYDLYLVIIPLTEH